jgi:tRNA 2-thiouridine synthesizing protein A
MGRSEGAKPPVVSAGLESRGGSLLKLIVVKPHQTVIKLDLRGVRCPLNWAHAKVRLERMEKGEMLDLVLDDPRGARDIPRAAEAEGYAMIESSSADGIFHLRIEK